MLLKDNIEDEKRGRILIFTTDESLEGLAKADTWLLDGNFSISPPSFSQMYVIRVKVSGTFVTSVYCLLEDKMEKYVEYMFYTMKKNNLKQTWFTEKI